MNYISSFCGLKIAKLDIYGFYKRRCLWYNVIQLRTERHLKAKSEKGVVTMNRGFIFGAGSFYGLQMMPTIGEYIVAADGGYQTCLRAGIVPSILVGDFDSMAKPVDFDHIIHVPVEKDDTDAMLAIKLALEKGCKEIYLYGTTGGNRLDHTIATLQSLLYIRRSGAKGYAYDQDFCFTVIENETLVLESQVDWGLLSVFAVGGTAQGVTIQGAQYGLVDGTLHPHVPMGVSNHFQGTDVTISVEQGALLVGWALPETEVSAIL